MTTCLRCHSLQAAAASSIAASAGQLNFTTKSVARSPGSSPVRDPAGIHQLSDFIPAFSPSSEPASFNSVFSYNTLFEQTSSADSTRTCKHAQFRFFQVRQLRLRQWKLQLQFQRHQLPGMPAILFRSRDSIDNWLQGNHYCSRNYGSSASNSNSYHYSNSNGRQVLDVLPSRNEVRD